MQYQILSALTCISSPSNPYGCIYLLSTRYSIPTHDHQSLTNFPELKYREIAMSPPHSVSLTPQLSSIITVRWSAPSDNGGRTDLYYEVDISDPDNLGSYTGTVYLSGRSTSRTISGLRPFTQYCVRVTAHNGVSDQDPNGQHLRRDEQCTRTLTAGKIAQFKIFIYSLLCLSTCI